MAPTRQDGSVSAAGECRGCHKSILPGETLCDGCRLGYVLERTPTAGHWLKVKPDGSGYVVHDAAGRRLWRIPKRGSRT